MKYKLFKKITVINLFIFLINPGIVIKAETIQNTQSASLTMETIENNNNQIIIEVIVDPNENNINTISLNLKYSTSTLELINTNLENSFCSLLIENTNNNITGVINISCGKPDPGTSIESIVSELYFKKINQGWASITIDQNSLVLANDGFGTNILNEISSKNFLIKQ